MESDLANEIAALAELTQAEYERRRRDAAKRLGIRVSILDTLVEKVRAGIGSDGGDDKPAITERPEPWPDPVDGLWLADEMRARFRAHVIFAHPNDADLAALWAPGTFLLDLCALFPAF